MQIKEMASLYQERINYKGKITMHIRLHNNPDPSLNLLAKYSDFPSSYGRLRND